MINHLALNHRSLSLLTALLCSACGDPSTEPAPAPAPRDEAPRAKVSPAGRADSSEANAAPISGSKLCEESVGAACDDEDPRDPEDSCRPTELVGVACAPSGEPVLGAEVTVQLQTCSGELQTFQTVTLRTTKAFPEPMNVLSA